MSALSVIGQILSKPERKLKDGEEISSVAKDHLSHGLLLQVSFFVFCVSYFVFLDRIFFRLSPQQYLMLHLKCALKRFSYLHLLLKIQTMVPCFFRKSCRVQLQLAIAPESKASMFEQLQSQDSFCTNVKILKQFLF